MALKGTKTATDDEGFASASVMIDKLSQDFAFVNVEEDILEEIEKAKKMKPEDVPEKLRKDVFEVPSSFQAAYNHPCPF